MAARPDAVSSTPDVTDTSLEESSVLLSLTPHVLQTLLREPALVITLGYLFVAMAGIFYNYTFYQRFGIPVLTLSQVGDFLVAGIQQPMAILLVATTFPIIWVFDRINVSRRRKRVAKRKLLLATGSDTLFVRARLWTLQSPPRWLTATVFVALIFLYGWMFVNQYARHRASDVVDGDAQMVSVWLTGSAEPLPSTSKAWTYLGAVGNYVFIYDRDARRSQILPVNNVARIQPAELVAQGERQSVIIAPIP